MSADQQRDASQLIGMIDIEVCPLGHVHMRLAETDGATVTLVMDSTAALQVAFQIVRAANIALHTRAGVAIAESAGATLQ